MLSLSILTWIQFLAFYLVTLPTFGYEKSTQSIEDVRKLEVQLIDARNIMRSRLQYCTAHWRDEDSPRSGRIKEYWHKALHKARTSYPDSITCLMELKPLLQKHKELRELLEQRKIEDDEKISAGLDAFLTRSQVQELRYFHENGDSKAVEEALDEYFEGLPSSRKNALISEFLDYESKLKRVQRDTDDSEQHIEEYDDEVLDPEQLKPEWLAWQTPRHKKLISKMIIGKANKWEVMNEIGDQFYHLRKEVRQQYKEYLQHYCIKNLKNVIGETNFNVLRGMYMDTDPVEQIETKFHELVAELHEERERLLADHYAVFCRKIFRLVHFEPTDLTIWLTSAQKFDLGQMIQNPDVNDTHIYDKMYEFYLNTTGEAREEAKDIIESGCRHFIEHMFGDDNAEELEELRLGGTISKQHLAARLAAHAFEVTDEMDRKRAEGSLSICSRIYLGYDGSCECHGHATSCDSVRHNCLNCTDNTYGVQCELCMESFTGDPLTGGCTPVEHEETSCTCNNHSSSCDPEGKCQSCLHNTTGDSCERCAPGFYGDATTGTRDDCTICPCPNNGECFVNENNLVECRECPTGKKGITCEEDVTPQEEEEGKHQKEKEKEGKKEERRKESNSGEEQQIKTEEHQEATTTSAVNVVADDTTVKPTEVDVQE